MATTMALIGGSTYASTTQDIKKALQEGRRWLVFRDDQVDITSTIDLDNYTTAEIQCLRLEGGGKGVTRLFTSNGTAPLFRATRPWHIYATGIAFQGGGGTGGQPLCEFQDITLSHFRNCHWEDGPGDGLSIGRTSSGGSSSPKAESIRFVECHFAGNGLNGLNIANGVDITLVGGSLVSNENHGLFWEPPSSKTGGVGTLVGVRVQSNLHQYGVWFHNLYLATVQNCHFNNDLIKVNVGSRHCLIERSVFENGATWSNDGGPTNIERDNDTI